MRGPGDTFPEEGAELLRGKISEDPEVAVILGSGLGDAVSDIQTEVDLPFTSLPGFPAPTVSGHSGRVVVGRLSGVVTAAFLGRVHFYEGHPMSIVTLPVRLSAALGVRTLIITAAVGGLDPSLRPGMLVVGADHLNFLGENPLRGWQDDEGRPPFVDLSAAYDSGLANLAITAAKEMGLPAASGVYAAVPGPTYETPAEVAFLRSAGATVVGMSVVPEVMAASALNMRCLGLYCVTNNVGSPVRHEEVTEVAKGFAGQLAGVLARVLSAL
ncbi:MAG TPA: purine-nucleoside phosphorylase [Actinomycetota bacterium]|nr:purine-nucleoside phosphorylase [Actinomycetota bacterium]